MSIKECSDLAEAISLEPSLGLYLKPFSRIKINVQIPRLNCPGQSISSYHVMEKVKETVWPDTFNYLKTLKIASNIMKLEGELETKASCERALSRLKATGSFKVNGFAEKLQIRAAHAAIPGPTRHDWEAFFRDAKGVNEMKPGERPDTLHLEDVPVKWFLDSGKSSKPSEKLLQRAFGSFGKIRRLEVKRMEDPKDSIATFGKTGSLHSDLLFEVYIQYEEYVEFSIAMDSLRGKKLLYKDTEGKVFAADIKVDFDRTNYLSDRCIKQREAEAQKLNPIVRTEKAKSVKDEMFRKHCKLPSEKEKEHTVKKIPGEGCNPENKPKIKSNFPEQEKTSKEAKLLLKELLSRAEKHKRSIDKKHQPPETSHVHEKDLINSKSEHFKLNKNKKGHLELYENKIEEMHSKTTPHSLHSKKNSLKRALDEQTDLRPPSTSNADIKKPSKKNKSSLELPNHCDSKKKSISEVQKTNMDVFEKGEREGEKHSKDKSRKQNKHMNSNERNIENDSKEYKNKEKHSHIPDKSEINLQHSNITKVDKRPANLPDKEKIKRQRLILQERLLKERLLQNLKARQEEKLKHREKLRKELAGRKVLKSVLADKNHSSCKKH